MSDPIEGRRTARVLVPSGELDGVKVTNFDIPVNSIENLRLALRGGRHTIPGRYVQLTVDGKLWMSDTDAEYSDHYPAIARMRRPEVRRVLITGLGLGLVLQAALDQPHIEHIDVIDINQRVINLVGAHYAPDPRVTLIHADAYEHVWPRGTPKWDVVWHDIWPDLCLDNLPQMDALKARYRNRTRWQGFWGRALLLRERARDNAAMGW
jgi:hypothetical protein